ncbi:MAG: hypothetical protein ACRD34_14290 [Bryobacteraceae bacterium]
MRETEISVTDAARNFADCVNRVHYQNAEFVLLRNGLPVARLAPAKEGVCSGRDLADALGKAKLPVEEARAWRRDLRAARKKLRRPADEWR